MKDRAGVSIQERLEQKIRVVVTHKLDLVRRVLGPKVVHQEKRFVVLAAGRTGSTFLCRMLDLQAGIVCAGEIFNTNAGYFFSCSEFAKHVDRPKEYRDKYPKEFLGRFWTFDSGGACLGIKVLFAQSSRAIDNLVADRCVKKVILTRRNKVKRYVSNCLAKNTRDWVKLDNKQKSQVQIRIEPDVLVEGVRIVDEQYERLRERLIDSDQEFKEIYYEDLIGESKIACLTDVAKFVGCLDIDQGCWREDATHKQNSDRLKDIVENYEELAEALAGTDLEQFLD